MRKKRFSSMSNIDVVKKYLAGERPYVTVSYNVSEKDKYHNEGDIWKDVDGIEWKKVDGKHVKTTKSQGDIIREAIGDGLDCKQCGMKHKWASKLDTKLMSRTSLCSDCLIDYETKLRILGIYDSYEKYRMASYELGYLRTSKEKIKETIAYFNDNDGDIVKHAESEYDESIVWKNTNKDRILKDATDDLKKISKLISSGIKITKQFKKEYIEQIAKYKLQDIITK